MKKIIVREVDLEGKYAEEDDQYTKGFFTGIVITMVIFDALFILILLNYT